MLVDFAQAHELLDGAQRGRARRGELAADFARQAADRQVIEVGGKQQRLVAPKRGDVPFLPANDDWFMLIVVEDRAQTLGSGV